MSVTKSRGTRLVCHQRHYYADISANKTTACSRINTLNPTQISQLILSSQSQKINPLLAFTPLKSLRHQDADPRIRPFPRQKA